VSIATVDVHEASGLAEQLDLLEAVFQTNYRRDASGRPTGAFLALYDRESQKRLLEATRHELAQKRQSALETLVLARGSIPNDLLERMWKASELFGWSNEKIAQKMNDSGIIAGMGGMRWTAKKVRAALADYDSDIAGGAIGPSRTKDLDSKEVETVH
jgi:hypothetical protein